MVILPEQVSEELVLLEFEGSLLSHQSLPVTPAWTIWISQLFNSEIWGSYSGYFEDYEDYCLLQCSAV
jgi:hypothetical protein